MSHLLESHRVVYGEAAVDAIPRYWRVAATTTDDGDPFDVVAESLPFTPDGVGGECLFKEAALQFSYTLGGQFRLSAFVHTSGELAGATPGNFSLVYANGAGLVLITPTPVYFTLPQQATDAQLQRATVIVPLLRRLRVGGYPTPNNEVSRFYCRGQSLVLRLDRLAPLSSGYLSLDGVRVNWEPVVRTDHQFVVTVPP